MTYVLSRFVPDLAKAAERVEIATTLSGAGARASNALGALSA
jgi:hypothetical protein